MKRATLSLVMVTGIAACAGSDFSGSGSKSDSDKGGKKETVSKDDKDDDDDSGSGSGSTGSSGSGSTGGSGAGNTGGSGSGAGGGSTAGATAGTGSDAGDGTGGTGTDSDSAAAKVTPGPVDSDPALIAITDGETACTGADLITFEKLPDGSTPADGAEIFEQYKATHGVTFVLESNKHPVLAKKGAPATAFNCGTAAGGECEKVEDWMKPGQKPGEFWLTDDGVISDGLPSPLLILYDTPVTKASGALYDVDGAEYWKIEGYDVDGNVVKTVTVDPGDGNVYDGKARFWSLVSPDKPIAQIRLEGRSNGGFGLGFDNFAPTVVCKSIQ